MKKFRNYANVILCGGIVIGLFVWAALKPSEDFSVSERSELQQFPEISIQSILSGKFMEEFEEYSTDQFPMRDTFRAMKASAALGVFRQSDIDGHYKVGDHIAQVEYPLNEKSVLRAAERFNFVCNKYLTEENKVYLSVIPDKNYFLGEESGHLVMDYEFLTELIRAKCAQMEYIDIFPLLEINDYYLTDTHWRQEKIVDVAEKLGDAMGADVMAQYTLQSVSKPFYGVYNGRMALENKPDTLSYLVNDTLEGCQVYDYQIDSSIEIYDTKKGEGRDPYELFLSGPRSLQVITNPNADTDKELIIFRDSFGSSIAPLLTEGYAKITLVDIRYIPSNSLSQYVDFEGADVLFLYSTSVLNNSETIK